MKNLNFEGNAMEDLGHLNGYCKFAKGKVLHLFITKILSIFQRSTQSISRKTSLNLSARPISALVVKSESSIFQKIHFLPSILQLSRTSKSSRNLLFPKIFQAAWAFKVELREFFFITHF